MIVSRSAELPVILIGDFNSAPGTSSYNLLAADGFTDAWRPRGRKIPEEANEEAVGFTCCQAANLRNVDSSLSVRLDLVLYRGNLSATRVDVVGNRQRDRTVSGLWPSDHAGVVAKVKLGEMEDQN